jgi:hypothetical protein
LNLKLYSGIERSHKQQRRSEYKKDERNLKENAMDNDWNTPEDGRKEKGR